MNFLSLVLSALVIMPRHAPPELPMISHAGQIVGRVAQVTRCEEFRFSDPLFVCPTRAQFVEMATFCAKNKTKEYQTSLFDCEDHTREFRVFAARWALKQFSGLPCGIAVGQAVVMIHGQVDGLGDYREGGLHAMIVVVLADGRTILLEPRNSHYIFPLSAVYEGVVEFHSIEF